MADPNFEINKEAGYIDSFMTEDRWNAQKMQGILPKDIVYHIVKNIIISKESSPSNIP